MKDVLFIIGSESDTQAVEPGLQLLSEKGMSFDLKVISAHRNLEQLIAFLKAEEAGYRVVIAAAGALRGASRRGCFPGETSRDRRAPCGWISLRSRCTAFDPAASARRAGSHHGNRKAGRTERRAPGGTDPQDPPRLSGLDLPGPSGIRRAALTKEPKGTTRPFRQMSAAHSRAIPASSPHERAERYNTAISSDVRCPFARDSGEISA